MSSSMVITVKSEKTQAQLQDLYKIDSNKYKEAARLLSGYFKDIASGITRGVVDVQTGSAYPVAASETLTLAGVAADETAVIGGVTFTAKASPSGENEFDQSGDDTADALSLATKIAAHSTLGKIVTASSAVGVVTVSCLLKGVVGNFITLVGDTNITAGAAALASGTGGSEDTASSFSLGL